MLRLRTTAGPKPTKKNPTAAKRLAGGGKRLSRQRGLCFEELEILEIALHGNC
jgi:hypothetical protein